MKYILKKPVLVALLFSLMSYCIYITVSNLALIYLEIISISLIGFIYVYEFKEPMPRDLRWSISVYFVIFSIIIYFISDTYDLLKYLYTPVYSITSAFSLFLTSIFIKELIKSPLLFGLTYIFLYMSGRVYLHLNKYSIKVQDKPILQEPLILAILLSSIYIIFVPMANYNLQDLYRFILFEIAIIFFIGILYVLKHKEIMPAKIKLETAMYFSLITLLIYFLNYTHNYSMNLGNSILDGAHNLSTTSAFIGSFLYNIYFDTYIIVTFLRYVSTHIFLDMPGKIFFYLKNKK